MKTTKTFPRIALAVKKHRTIVKMSQTDLSGLLGYTNGQFISNVERAICSVPLKDLKKLSIHISCPLSTLKEAILADFVDHMNEVLK